MTRPWTVDDIPDQSGRVAVVTGSNTGLGLETAKALAGKGARVVLAVRNVTKGAVALASITAEHPGAEVSVQPLDLASLRSVREAAAQLLTDLRRIDLLINNAGVMCTPYEVTEDGFELQLGTNHLGHFALTGLLIDRILETPGSRVVTMSSVGHRIGQIHFDDLQLEHSYSRTGGYGQAKLANIMFTLELQRRLATRMTVAVAAHPGGSQSELDRSFPRIVRIITRLAQPLVQSAAAGALPLLRAATDPHVLGGQYYGPRGLGGMRGRPVLAPISLAAQDAAARARLWTVSEELTGVNFPI